MSNMKRKGKIRGDRVQRNNGGGGGGEGFEYRRGIMILFKYLARGTGD